MKITPLDTGFCLAAENHLIRGGARRTVECHALSILFEHPSEGRWLLDSGYAPRIYAATRRLPQLLLRFFTPMRIRPEQAAAVQLRVAGIDPAEIRYVVVTHFHPDHVAGLRDFPNARFVASGEAVAAIEGLSGLGAFRKGVIPSLLPDDFFQRLSILGSPSGPTIGALGQTHDLFGDGSALVVRLPGHARGQIGVLTETERGRLLFAADSCWLTRSIRERRPPARLTNLLVDDPGEVGRTIGRLADFALRHADVRLLPNHCPEAYDWLFNASARA